MLSRRRFLRNGLLGVTGAAASVGLYTWLWEPEWLSITRRPLLIAGLPESLHGATLAHLSDLHIGPKVRDGYIRKTFETVAALRPDIVVVTGDWITYRGPQQYDQLSRLLEFFPHGRRATIGILGNHDYGFGWKMAEVGDMVARLCGAAGITILRNASTDVHGLTVIGLEDLWGPHFGPGQVLGRPAGARLVLSHNPDSADRPVWDGYQGWILAGHTHGGQCKPPFLPPPLLPGPEQAVHLGRSGSGSTCDPK